MKFMLKSIFLSITTLVLSSASFAQTFESTEKPTALIELYTSEGCSSCPPADRWLSSLKSDERLWKDFVPLAFHVDYWDYIGWPDRFASKRYSQRQRRYASEFSESTVYTPGVRWGGYEWRSWRRNALPDSVPVESSAVLKLSVDDNGDFVASYDDDGTATRLNIAILGSELQTEVKRGENHGRTLSHDFVVLDYQVIEVSSDGQWKGQIAEPKIQAPKYSIAVWTTESGSQLPLQATGGYLDADLWQPES